MSRTDRARVVAAPPGWALGLLLLAVVFGVLGMHALGSHGAPAGPGTAAGRSAVAGHGAGMPAAAEAGMSPARIPGSTDLLLPAAPAPDHGLALTDLCLAVLVGMGLAALLTVSARRRSGWLVALAVPAGWRPSVPRPPPAPTLAQLSLLRC